MAWQWRPFVSNGRNVSNVRDHEMKQLVRESIKHCELYRTSRESQSRCTDVIEPRGEAVLMLDNTRPVGGSET